MKEITFTTVSTEQEVRQMLALQKANLKSKVSAQTAENQGFVTVCHEPDTLLAMNRAHPSAIAKSGEVLAGYCIMMPQSFRNQIPELVPMFEMLNTLSWRGKPLKHNPRWFVMGQVCVAEAFRGMGVFDGMYQKLREAYSSDFDFVITEISRKNIRSMRAHARVGFEAMHVYEEKLNNEVWEVVVWDWL